jgi:DNA-binding transcriptional ArsR family regulator
MSAPPRQAELFAALGDPTRLRLVRRLSAEGPLSITRLTEGEAVTRQAVTKHLEVLDPRPLAAARGFLDDVSRRWDDALARLRLLVEE